MALIISGMVPWLVFMQCLGLHDLQVVHLDAITDQLTVDATLAVTIGNFDGVHRGHQSLIENTIRLAADHQLKSAALTFDPHPEEFFARRMRSEERLFTIDQKIRSMSELGLDYLIVQSFYDGLSQLTSEQFLHDYLYNHLKVRAITVGENFQFGYKRQGNSSTLKEYCERQNMSARLMSASSYQDEMISSTRVRKVLLHNGAVEDAREMLGRPYAIEGLIARGDQLGRKLGFPTANIHHIDQLIPANGVYAGWIWCSGKSDFKVPPVMKSTSELMLAVINIGHRPTVKRDGLDLRVEAHIIDEDIAKDELYNQKCTIYLCKRLRGELAFEGVDDLKQAIQENVDQTKAFRKEILF